MLMGLLIAEHSGADHMERDLGEKYETFGIFGEDPHACEEQRYRDLPD